MELMCNVVHDVVQLMQLSSPHSQVFISSFLSFSFEDIGADAAEEAPSLVVRLGSPWIQLQKLVKNTLVKK